MRPKQEPAHRIFDRKTHEPIDVLTHEAMYTITYDDKLMNIRQIIRYKSGQYSKYIYTIMSCKASAEAKCKRLNKLFKTDKFKVTEIRI